jgi:deoxycytidylate deaminase
LRSITDYFGNTTTLETSPHYSPFEKGNATETSSYKYKGKNPGNFKEAVVDYFKEAYSANEHHLNGKNCSFCFKTVHNHFEGEANQVHTRSLHAEENAMLQITKLGGMGAEGGFLFTTASPCELCAKKAYQLGVTKIFFIDPYPGISVDQILRGGLNNSQPKLIPFYGAIGNAYHELYDSFMSYKDEIAMTLEIKPKQKTVKELNNALSKIDDSEIKNFLKETNLSDDEVVSLVKDAIKLYKSKGK